LNSFKLRQDLSVDETAHFRSSGDDDQRVVAFLDQILLGGAHRIVDFCLYVLKPSL
jgi:hypothetical protein